jgi:Zn-dependent alcohol dehydrogenase
VYVQVAQGEKMCGASMIIGVDMNPAKEEVGKSFPFAVFYIARCRILLSAT